MNSSASDHFCGGAIFYSRASPMVVSLPAEDQEPPHNGKSGRHTGDGRLRRVHLPRDITMRLPFGSRALTGAMSIAFVQRAP
jgi:hypothetical protein